MDTRKSAPFIDCIIVLAVGAAVFWAWAAFYRTDEPSTAPPIVASAAKAAPNVLPTPTPVDPPRVETRAPIPSAVLKIADSFPNGGGFNWDRGTGTPEEIRFGGQRILTKSKRGTYCCGFTFAVVMRAAAEGGLLKGKSVTQIKKFQQHWYAATPEAREKQQIFAMEWLGIGKQVPFMDAEPGDFVRLWHGGSGHSVIFVRWVAEDGRKVGA